MSPEKYLFSLTFCVILLVKGYYNAENLSNTVLTFLVQNLWQLKNNRLIHEKKDDVQTEKGQNVA